MAHYTREFKEQLVPVLVAFFLAISLCGCSFGLFSKSNALESWVGYYSYDEYVKIRVQYWRNHAYDGKN